ncbi:hypothetical protein H0H93_011276, partial [Arthromyces matolae]
MEGILLLFLSFQLTLVYATTTVEVSAAGLNLDFGPASHPDDPFWLESIKHQGTSAFNPDPTYQVFRNVKVGVFFQGARTSWFTRKPQDFGATGDGVTDDTQAI